MKLPLKTRYMQTDRQTDRQTDVVLDIIKEHAAAPLVRMWTGGAVAACVYATTE